MAIATARVNPRASAGTGRQRMRRRDPRVGPLGADELNAVAATRTIRRPSGPAGNTRHKRRNGEQIRRRREAVPREAGRESRIPRRGAAFQPCAITCFLWSLAAKRVAWIAAVLRCSRSHGASLRQRQDEGTGQPQSQGMLGFFLNGQGGEKKRGPRLRRQPGGAEQATGGIIDLSERSLHIDIKKEYSVRDVRPIREEMRAREKARPSRKSRSRGRRANPRSPRRNTRSTDIKEPAAAPRLRHEERRHDHRPPEGQDARRGRQHGDDQRHVAGAAHPRAQGSPTRHARWEQLRQGMGIRRCHRNDGGIMASLPLSSAGAMEQMRKTTRKVSGTSIGNDDARPVRIKEQTRNSNRNANLAILAAC